MIHYSYCLLNIDSWKILSPGESQDTGQGAEGDGSGSLFLRFYSLSNKILIVMNMFLKASHTVDWVDEDGGNGVAKYILL